jgi:hypothetical protein
MKSRQTRKGIVDFGFGARLQNMQLQSFFARSFLKVS